MNTWYIISVIIIFTSVIYFSYFAIKKSDNKRKNTERKIAYEAIVIFFTFNGKREVEYKDISSLPSQEIVFWLGETGLVSFVELGNTGRYKSILTGKGEDILERFVSEGLSDKVVRACRSDARSKNGISEKLESIWESILRENCK